MRKPDADESNVQMSDVLCDFCRREWTDDIAMIEGHRGSCICADCLRAACLAVGMSTPPEGRRDFTCIMCLESEVDRIALNRAEETGWMSPRYSEAVICRRCVRLAAGVLERADDFEWSRPANADPPAAGKATD